MNLYPAVQARMGSWTYYIARMSMRDVAAHVDFGSKFESDRTLEHAIQRTLNEGRAKKEIARYLQHPDRFFSSIVVAAMGGNPTFSEVKIEYTAEQKLLTRGMAGAFGVLAFDGGEKYYALDGQHRLKAIKYLLDASATEGEAPPEGFDDDQVSVLLVCAEKKDKKFLRLYRRLFSSLNRYAKPTNADTNIIMDEDDMFAIITRRMINDHPFFQAKGASDFRVQTEDKNIHPSVPAESETGKKIFKPSPCFTTLQTLYAMNEDFLTTEQRACSGWANAQEMRNFKQFRVDDEVLEQYYKELVLCWDALIGAIPDLSKPPETMRDHQMPGNDHVLFWPIGQEVLAKVARRLLDEACSGENTDDIIKAKKALAKLGKVDWQLHSPPWRNLFLIWEDGKGEKPGAWKMRTGSRDPARKIALRLILWIIGVSDENENDLKTEWRNRLVPAQEEKDAKRHVEKSERAAEQTLRLNCLSLFYAGRGTSPRPAFPRQLFPAPHSAAKLCRRAFCGITIRTCPPTRSQPNSEST